MEGFITLIEADSWGWAREGFNRGWISILNFTVPNEYNSSMVMELNSLQVPPGVKYELYIDNNNDSLIDLNDTLIAFDNDYDGYLNPTPDYDSDQDGHPEVTVTSYENKTFLVYLRADYMYHFLSKYHKTIDPTGKSEIIFKKQTVYDTTLMRIFLDTDYEVPQKNDDIEYEEKQSGTNYFYYGEWTGEKDNDLEFLLEVESDEESSTSSPDQDNQRALTIILILIIIVSTLIVGSMAYGRIGKKHKKTSPVKKKSSKAKSTKDHSTKKKKHGKSEKIADKKLQKALRQLEEDYEAGELDEDVYHELREQYQKQLDKRN
jgi:hypothetical protein